MNHGVEKNYRLGYELPTPNQHGVPIGGFSIECRDPDDKDPKFEYDGRWLVEGWFPSPDKALQYLHAILIRKGVDPQTALAHVEGIARDLFAHHGPPFCPPTLSLVPDSSQP